MKLIKQTEDRYVVIKDNSILYATYPVDYAEQINLQEVKELIGEVDVNILAANLANPNACKTTNWIEGYNQALEDNKEKKYTEEDIRKAYDDGYSVRDTHGDRSDNMTSDEYVKSLQPKTEWEVEIVDGKLKLI